LIRGNEGVQLRAEEIVEVDEAGDLIRAVIDLANGPAKRTLGFLPDEGFRDRARKGTLLALVVGDRLLGYALYDLKPYEVKIVHVCVADSARRGGVARRLIEEVVARHADCRRIVLSCRHDYEATRVWEALGFRPQASRPGRSKAGHLLTVWVLDYEDLSLFDDFQDERVATALDHNVFLDLHIGVAQRSEGIESRYLLSDWVGEHIELCVTDEVFYEIHLLDDQAQRATEQKWASSYRNLSKPGQEWSDLVSSVAKAAPRAGVRDHRHVARAAIGGAKYFVSRDEDLLAGSDSIQRAVGIQVLRPGALVVRLDRQRADDSYQPIALQGTELRQLSPPDDLHEVLLSTLLNHGDGERRTNLGSRLRPMFADRGNHDVQIVQSSDGSIVAGFARRAVDGALEVPFIRVSPASRGATVIARQLLFAQRERAADLGLRSVTITDPHPSRDIREALALERFQPEGSNWRCVVKTGLIQYDEALPSEGLLNPLEDASAYEAAYWPAKVVGAGLANFVVPIKLSFAEALIDPKLAERSLLPRKMHLGLNREHVYYRSTQNSRGLSRGARVLWYVAGDSPALPRGSIRAVSRVEEVVTGRPRTLHARFERFGIYSREQVTALADRNNQVMAIRFVDTEVFKNPLTIETLRSLWSDNGERFFAPQSPTKISERMFCLVYRQSSAYVS
jgi:GNAT superfamily N-acetyltransferase